ncbi:hypothetical protein COL60_16565 [Bacillus pseudomycoides]|uniref:hypothetical protein n=1 Tax=Bacillus pseudomycoides TaxID=64104 RepID=UPI000BF83722|nr:hypothetical protein [Bacillus pseudomycoides]PFZ08438.1 hypothetical protein COL60_16565 [Bacillus pseudomycoides]PFZ09824.1 hypothetical protein COL63_21385 [Bacillus pseudomycoides]
MKLSKQEQTVIIGQLINIIGVGLAKQHIDSQELEKAVAMHNEISDDMTPKQTRETLISVLDKTIGEFLKA